MKRYGNIYEKICDMDNLRLAHQNAREDKLFYKEVKMVDSDPDKYLSMIREMLLNETYQVSEYTISIINDKGKERELAKLPYFPDRIIQWAIMLQVEDIFLKTFCSHTCSSIPGRGIKEAYMLTTKYMKDRINTKYCLKIDVSKFYPSINHDILKKMLRKKFKDKRLLSLFDKIIDSYPKQTGVPIGSYLSQYLANFYLAYFDHWLKEEMGVKYVVRFADDMVIFAASKQELHSLIHEIKKYMKDNIEIRVKDNWQVFPTNTRGIDFVGYRFFYDFILLRKSTCKRFKRKMLKIKAKWDDGKLPNYSEWCSANSYIGWLKWCDSWRLFEKYIEPIVNALVAYYKFVIKKDAKPKARNNAVIKYVNKIYQKKGRVAA